MSKFYAYCVDSSLKDNNGGSLVLKHHLCALEQLGHESGGMINLNEPVPDDADFIMFQSEWWNCLKPFLEKTKAKKICWLGHYNTGERYQMPKIEEIKADYFHTQYKGEAVEWGKKKIGRGIYYLPHAGCNKCNALGKKIESPKAVFIGNSFPEREENWLNYAGVQIKRAPFSSIKDYYYSSVVCPNIHGDFQKGKACEFFQTPAHMINERIFQVILSGGFCVSDDTLIVAEFFTQEEVPQCKTKEEFRDKINYFINNPKDREVYMQKAKDRIRKEHLYIHRWEKYLKEIL